jgi:cytochrome c oxidase cbb3-type subunit 3
MADFTSSFWSIYIAVLTIAGIIGCAWLLWRMSSRRVSGSSVETTGHQWDETLAEYNHPLPRWWMGLFVITIVFGVVYLVLFPGLGSFAGVLGWTSIGQHAREVAQADAQYGPLFKAFAARSVEDISKDPQARDIGERLFLNYCAQCHGSDAHGTEGTGTNGPKGFPNLTDSDWLYGGTAEDITRTITMGRHGVMPPMGAAVGSADDVRNLAEYVLSLSGSAHDSLRAQLGREKFAACVACHGPEGKGNTAIGAPNLTDRIWLHGGSVESIVQTITRGRDNQMPAHGELLGPDKVHVLAGYVYGLSRR